MNDNQIRPECVNPCHECLAINRCIDHTADAGNIVGTTLDVLLELDVWWGNSRLGTVLCSAYFSRQPLTTEEIAEFMGLSTETVRRQLKPLINIDRVQVIREGRSVRYKAHQEWAVKTRAMLMRARDKINTALDGELSDVRWVMPKPLKALNLDPDHILKEVVNR